jgi:Thaumatin family
LLAVAANTVVILAVTMLAACTAPGGSVATPAGHIRPAAAAKAARTSRAHAHLAIAAAATVTSPAPAPQPGTAPPSAAASPAAASPAVATFRLFTFVNRENQTIWLAASPDTSHHLSRTGWKLRPGQSVTVRVPNKYNGRFWGRTGCVFHDGKGSCETGDCGGLFQCTGWGAIPATLVEVNLDAWMNLDFYDISMVDGSNGPLYMTPTSGQATKKVSTNGCIPKGCTKPVACPSVLQIKAHGSVVACESACAKLGGDQYCCRGKWAPRAMCRPAKWPVDYARVFKRAEPYAYSYVDDDATSVYTCKGRCN